MYIATSDLTDVRSDESNATHLIRFWFSTWQRFVSTFHNVTPSVPQIPAQHNTTHLQNIWTSDKHHKHVDHPVSQQWHHRLTGSAWDPKGRTSLYPQQRSQPTWSRRCESSVRHRPDGPRGISPGDTRWFWLLWLKGCRTLNVKVWSKVNELWVKNTPRILIRASIVYCPS